MKRLFFIIFHLIFITATAQESLMPMLPEKDSLITDDDQLFMDNSPISEENLSFELTESLLLPDFNFKKELASRWRYNINGLSSYPWDINIIDMGIYGFPFYPVTFNGVILSEGSYRINDRFTIGGYSFGANRLLSAPVTVQGNNNFNFRGSTLFFKYKVSDKFKIETRFNVTQDHGF
jgi:hypothetical protein